MMKQVLVCIILLLVATATLIADDYTRVDARIRNYPKSMRDPEKLAERIKNDFEQPDEVVRAIYTWIALNIKYDVKPNSADYTATITYSTPEEKERKLYEHRKELAVRTLKNGEAICFGYSSLFNILCDLTSIECEVISGTSKTLKQDIGQLPKRSDHAWNAVRINNEWKLVDVTWAAGYQDMRTGKYVQDFSDVFFFSDPEKFFLKHYPNDPKWLLIDKSEKDFANLPLFYRDYLENDVELIEPETGIIKTGRNKRIEVVLKNAANKDITFRFERESNVFEVKPVIRNGLCHYVFRAGHGSYLNVYLNNSGLMVFRLE